MAEVSLTGWMKALIAYVRSGEPDLTNRQMALLMLVYLTPGPHTVRGLARVLGVSKPVVTRALNTLGALGYLRRERDQDDRRKNVVQLTDLGRATLRDASRAGADAERRFLGALSDDQAARLIEALRAVAFPASGSPDPVPPRSQDDRRA